MPQVGPVGQRKLMETKVLIVGAGGLGGPAALYLALAGVGTIGIVDFDIVDLSNLQRQVLHQNDDVGKQEDRIGEGDAPLLQPRRRTSSSTTRRSPPTTRWRSSRSTTTS